MNYKFFSVLFILAAFFGCTKKNIIVQNYESEQIVHCSKIRTIDNITNYVIYLNEGDSIPLKITLDSEFIGISDEEVNLILKRKVYFRLRMPENYNAEEISSMNEEERRKTLKKIRIYLSPDAVKWAPYNDIKAVEQLFGIKGGFFSVGMGITKEEGVQIFLSAGTTNM
jgi:hypothetical protein